MPRTTPLLAALAVTALAAGGCGSGNTGVAPKAAVSPTRAAVTPLPEAIGKQVLLVSGAVTGQGGGGRVIADMAGLEALPHHELTVVEPFVKKRATFSGVLVSDLLASAGAGAAATTLDVHALDDYKMTFQIADLVSQHALVATSSDGQPMAVKIGGPIRLIFPDGTKLSRDPDLWVWSIDTMTVR